MFVFIATLARADTNNANTLTPQERASGWRLLWDGQTSKGWRSVRSQEFPTKGWVIRDGMLIVLAGNGGELAVGEDIITTERYSDLELSADFKIVEGANSGIKYFVRSNVDPVTGSRKEASLGAAIGYEFQILDDARHPDAKLGRDGNRTLGSLYDLIPPGPGKHPNAIGEWNTARIAVKGGHVEHWLNGAKVLEFERGTPEFRARVAASKFSVIPDFGSWAEGHILLQNHGGEVSFRNLKIRTPSTNRTVRSDKATREARRGSTAQPTR